jgi:phosphate transport system substrate-binding protein
VVFLGAWCAATEAQSIPLFSTIGEPRFKPPRDQLGDSQFMTNFTCPRLPLYKRRLMNQQTFAAAIVAAFTVTSAAVALDASLSAYQPVTLLSGQLKSVGSDTLGNEMEGWAKGFMALYPEVKIEVEAKGSATAPASLLRGISQLAPMSRFMTKDEAAAFEKKYGYKATGVRVAVDALAVYVNIDNPIRCLTLQQVDRIFSSTRISSSGQNIKTWGNAGLSGDWAARPIALFGRNTISGTYEFLREAVLYGGEYKNEVTPEPGSEAVVANVAADKSGIGYAGIGFKTANVRAVPLAAFDGRPCIEATEATTFGGRYPIARYLYVFVNKNPNQPLDALRSEFIKYVLSKEGQERTIEGGFYPITNEIREAELNKLGIATAK